MKVETLTILEAGWMIKGLKEAREFLTTASPSTKPSVVREFACKDIDDRIAELQETAPAAPRRTP